MRIIDFGEEDVLTFAAGHVGDDDYPVDVAAYTQSGHLLVNINDENILEANDTYHGSCEDAEDHIIDLQVVNIDSTSEIALYSSDIPCQDDSIGFRFHTFTVEGSSLLQSLDKHFNSTDDAVDEALKSPVRQIVYERLGEPSTSQSTIVAFDSETAPLVIADKSNPVIDEHDVVTFPIEATEIVAHHVSVGKVSRGPRSDILFSIPQLEKHKIYILDTGDSLRWNETSELATVSGNMTSLHFASLDGDTYDDLFVAIQLPAEEQPQQPLVTRRSRYEAMSIYCAAMEYEVTQVGSFFRNQTFATNVVMAHKKSNGKFVLSWFDGSTEKAEGGRWFAKSE